MIDLLFLLDIIVTFNTATQEEGEDLIENRKNITINYLKGWFAIDVIAITPFDLILSSTNFGSMARIARMGRLYKIAKLFRLVRVLKFMKDQSKLLKQIHEILKIGAGLESLFFFLIVFLLLTHIGACMWITIAQLEMDFRQTEDYKTTWLEDHYKAFKEQNDTSPVNLYGISYYWTIQTISTVGYGDISIGNNAERSYCIIVMVLGVVAFGIANGHITSIISSVDSKNALYQEKLEVLNNIYKEY